MLSRKTNAVHQGGGPSASRCGGPWIRWPRHARHVPIGGMEALLRPLLCVFLVIGSGVVDATGEEYDRRFWFVPGSYTYSDCVTQCALHRAGGIHGGFPAMIRNAVDNAKAYATMIGMGAATGMLGGHRNGFTCQNEGRWVWTAPYPALSADVQFFELYSNVGPGTCTSGWYCNFAPGQPNGYCQCSFQSGSYICDIQPGEPNLVMYGPAAPYERGMWHDVQAIVTSGCICESVVTITPAITPTRNTMSPSSTRAASRSVSGSDQPTASHSRTKSTTSSTSQSMSMSESQSDQRSTSNSLSNSTSFSPSLSPSGATPSPSASTTASHTETHRTQSGASSSTPTHTSMFTLSTTASSSASSTLSNSWCMHPAPSWRFVHAVIVPDDFWTASSNDDEGNRTSTLPTHTRTFSDTFPAHSSKATTKEVVSIVYQKVSGVVPPWSVDFDLPLSSQYGTFAAVGRRVAKAVNGKLSVVVTVIARDALHLRFDFDNRSLLQMYTQQTVDVAVAFKSFVCFDVMTFEYVPKLTLSVTFVPVHLTFALSIVSAAASASSIVTLISGSPTAAAVTSRISLLRGYVDCAYDDTQDGGFSVTGYYYGPPSGQFLRGAVVGNMALLFGMCVALVTLCVLFGCVVACLRQASVLKASRMILEMMHVPSVFAVPLAQTLQPTVAASVQLLFARAGDSNDDVLVAVLGLATVAFFAIYFTVVMLQQQPWSLAPRTTASLDKRLNAYGGVFFWLRGKECRVRDVVARVLFTVFEAREHWQLADRPEAKRVKRRLLMLFEDTRQMWFPVVDLWSSVAVSVIAGLAPLSTLTVCFWQLLLTTAIFAALLVMCVIVRPAMNHAGTVFIVATNALNAIATASLLTNNINPKQSAVGVATTSMILLAVVATVVSIPGIIRLVIRVVVSVKRVMLAFPPRARFIPKEEYEHGVIDEQVFSPPVNDEMEGILLMEEEEEEEPHGVPGDDISENASSCLAAPNENETLVAPSTMYPFLFNLLMTHLAEAIATSDDTSCEMDFYRSWMWEGSGGSKDTVRRSSRFKRPRAKSLILEFDNSNSEKIDFVAEDLNALLDGPNTLDWKKGDFDAEKLDDDIEALLMSS